MSIPKSQKHTTDHPCGVCQGYESGKRGSGERCWGFTSEDDKYVYCSRDDHAGGLQMNASAQAYRHYMVGKCDCGTNHTGSFEYMSKVYPSQRTIACLLFFSSAFLSLCIENVPFKWKVKGMH